MTRLFSGSVQTNNHILQKIVQQNIDLGQHQDVQPDKTVTGKTGQLGEVGTGGSITEKRLLSCTVPPDRCKELQNIADEIATIREKLKHKENVPVEIIRPGKSEKSVEIRTVPPNFAVRTSTRKGKHEKARIKDKLRKGVEPEGRNGEIWKGMWSMKKMFLEGKLKRGTLAEKSSTSATLTGEIKSKTKPKIGTVPPSPRGGVQNLSATPGMLRKCVPITRNVSETDPKPADNPKASSSKISALRKMWEDRGGVGQKMKILENLKSATPGNRNGK
jgi:hypothetical protein